MKWIFLLCGVVLIAVCGCKKNKIFTVDLNFTCMPIQYFDTLQTVLLTNDKRDLHGESNGLEILFAGRRVYKKNLPKRNGHFYIDSIENKEYWMLFIECKFQDAFYGASKVNIDFSDNNKDTFVVDICVQPYVQYIPQE